MAINIKNSSHFDKSCGILRHHVWWHPILSLDFELSLLQLHVAASDSKCLELLPKGFLFCLFFVWCKLDLAKSRGMIFCCDEILSFAPLGCNYKLTLQRRRWVSWAWGGGCLHGCHNTCLLRKMGLSGAMALGIGHYEPCGHRKIRLKGQLPRPERRLPLVEIGWIVGAGLGLWRPWEESKLPY